MGWSEAIRLTYLDMPVVVVHMVLRAMAIKLKSWHSSLPIVTFVFTNFDICPNPLWCFSLPTVSDLRQSDVPTCHGCGSSSNVLQVGIWLLSWRVGICHYLLWHLCLLIMTFTLTLCDDSLYLLWHLIMIYWMTPTQDFLTIFKGTCSVSQNLSWVGTSWWHRLSHTEWLNGTQ